MIDHRDTDERLKTRLNSDQIGRERMCTAILAIDRRYSRVEPRRPEGGPDGARDIQAMLSDGCRVFGAVGFQNSVTDSNDDKRNTINKFKSDLSAALEEKPDLKAFVFFTNTDLTPGEQDALRQEASARGVTDVDIYWRERILQVLNSPQGLGLRYQYLKINLSPAEQAAFFNNYNIQLEDLILKQHERLDEGVRRLEFLHWMSRPLQQFQFNVRLNRFVTPEELGPFRILARLFTGSEIGNRGWYIGGSDDYLQHSIEGNQCLCFGHKTVISISHEPALTMLGGSRVYTTRVANIDFGAEYRFGERPAPEAIDGSLMRIYATRNLAEIIKAVEVNMNGYAIVRMPKVEFGKTSFEIDWPEQAAMDAGTSEWLAGSSGPLMLPHVSLDRTAARCR